MRYLTKHIMVILMLLLVPIYLISCTGNSTTSLPSEKIAAVAKNPPNVPTNLTAVGADGHVDLKWTPPAGENIATSYNLYWNTTGGVTETSNKILNVSMPFTHMELLNSKTYYYRVSGVNIYGEGPLSLDEVQATPMLPFTKILAKLTDPDFEQSDEFGYSVAIDGDYAVVGARRSQVRDSNNIILEDAGAAYVFRRTDGVWDSRLEAIARLTAPDAQSGDFFGCSVAISGTYIIVGAMGEDGGPGDPMESAGAVYIFHRTGENSWDSGVMVSASAPYELSRFGAAVSISGDYAIVGQKGASMAYVFRRTGTNSWDAGASLWTPEAPGGDLFGISVAISGNYAIVGASGDDGTADLLTDAGAAYIFHRTDVNEWSQMSKIVPHDGSAGDHFGNSVAISGDYAAVGAYHKDTSTGAVYVFHRLDENFWDEGPKVTAPDAQEGDFFGWSIGITDKYLIVGAFSEDCGWDENHNEGAAYVYERIGANSWDGGTKVTIPEGDASDNFGFAVGISGESTIISAIGDDCDKEIEVPNTGAVYLY